MSRPSLTYRTLAVPRAGEEQTEDAVAVQKDQWPVSVAVADGATESMFSGVWAETVAQGIVETGATTQEAFADAVSDWQAVWRADVAERASEGPWYVNAKAEEGAYAAVLGVSFRAHGEWQAVSVGDCELLQVRNDTLTEAWPFDRPEAFTHRPALLPSRSPRPRPVPAATTGTWQPGDAFLLATDAVAAWLLRTDPVQGLHLDEKGFPQRVASARADGTLRNDDATLLIAKMGVK